jgi:hypothetical protein
MIAMKIGTLRMVFKAFRQYQPLLNGYGKEVKTANTPLRLLLRLFKERIVKVEVGYYTHVWVLHKGCVELIVTETDTDEVVDVRYFA